MVGWDKCHTKTFYLNCIRQPYQHWSSECGHGGEKEFWKINDTKITFWKLQKFIPSRKNQYFAILKKKKNGDPQNETPSNISHHTVCRSALCIQLFRVRLSEKGARDNPERYCGWFWVHCSSKEFERMAREAIEVCWRMLKESSNRRFDSVLIISHITFRDCRVHIFSNNLSRNSCILSRTDNSSVVKAPDWCLKWIGD